MPRLYGNEVELAKPTIFMEYVQGATLRDVLPSLGDDQREKVRAIVEETLRILHRAGISHGDVTATNVVVDSRGEKATLVDFGAVRLERRVSRKLWERLQGEDLGALADIFDEAASEKASL